MYHMSSGSLCPNGHQFNGISSANRVLADEAMCSEYHGKVWVVKAKPLYEPGGGSKKGMLILFFDIFFLFEGVKT